jgi:hypothetical protein
MNSNLMVARSRNLVDLGYDRRLLGPAAAMNGLGSITPDGTRAKRIDLD